MNKIITFLSEFKNNKESCEYLCPNNEKVNGIETNDAPLAYFLKTYDDIDKVICITTPEAEKTYSTLEKTYSEKNVEFIRIQYELTKEKFEQKPLQEIMDCFKTDMKGKTDKSDSILLDITGGTRDIPMYLLLVSRLLSYKGVKTEGIIYSQFVRSKKEGIIHDVTNFLQLFDLIEAMNSFTKYGKTDELIEYYKNKPEFADLEIMFDKMETFTENLTLCRNSKHAFNDFNESYRQIEKERISEPITRSLIDTFKTNFTKESKMTTPALIKCYVNMDMVQQALTFYRENIAVYILHENKKITKLDKIKSSDNKLAHHDEYDDKLNGFLNYPLHSLKAWLKENEENIKSYVESGEDFNTSQDKRKLLENIKLAIDEKYNNKDSKKENIKKFIYSEHRNEKSKNKLLSSITSNINDEDLILLSEDQTAVRNQKIYNIENLRELSRETGCEYKADIEKIKTILTDYLFICQIRNMINHGSETNNADKECTDYFNKNGYPDIYKMSIDDIKKAIIKTLEHLK